MLLGVNAGSERRRAAAAISGAAALVFFALVWHASAHWSWPAALTGAALMGLVVFGSQWFLMRAAGRRSAQPGGRGK
jgi:sugar phosphate permease